jgi:O-antigen ligase
MDRTLYLTALVVLQIALIVYVSPPLAQGLSLEMAPGLAPEGWPTMLQLVGTSATIAGSSIALAFPALALVRHRRSGPQRFLALPAWATMLASSGTAATCAAFAALALVPVLPVDVRMTAVLVARPIAAGGLALAAAGVVCAELLRRSVAAGRETACNRKAGRIEVTHPPELRTREA